MIKLKVIETKNEKIKDVTEQRLTLREARDRQSWYAYLRVASGQRRVRDSSSEARAPRGVSPEPEKACDLRRRPDRLAANWREARLPAIWRTGLSGLQRV